MAKRSPTNRTKEQRINVLDVTLLDLFAQIESLLRSGRDVQRHIIGLRPANGNASAKRRRAVIAKIRHTVKQIAREHKGMSTVVRAMDASAKDLE